MWAHALLESFHACNFWLKMKNHIKKKKREKETYFDFEFAKFVSPTYWI